MLWLQKDKKQLFNYLLLSNYGVIANFLLHLCSSEKLPVFFIFCKFCEKGGGRDQKKEGNRGTLQISYKPEYGQNPFSFTFSKNK